jgi:glycosyltransferase involved in cell wall biosynthesis
MPKVTCVCPTNSRQDFIPLAIECFLQQDFTDSELLIVDDGIIPTIIPIHSRIRYVWVPKMDIGTKRNFCNERAYGKVIAHWDDDDWSGPTRLSQQVCRIISQRKAVTGYFSMHFFDVHSRRVSQIITGSGHLPYAMGTSLCYLKSFWKKNPFPAGNTGEDIAFNNRAKALNQLDCANGLGIMVVRRHSTNTCQASEDELMSIRDLPQGFQNALRLNL